MPVTDEFAKAIVMLAEAYNAALTRERIEVYSYALEDLPINQLRAAMAQAVRECKFFPTAAELRTLALGSPEDAGLQAWTRFQRAAETGGAYQPVDVEDRAAAEALLASCGSWPAFCALEDGPGQATKRAEFLAAYRAAQRGQLGTMPGRRAMDVAGVRPTRLPGLVGTAGAATWVTRIALTGAVEAQRERPLLPAAPETKQLTGGGE